MTKQSIVEGRAGKRTACAYIRSSLAEQFQQGEAIAEQISSIVGWCDKNDVVLVDVYSEFGASGSDRAQPELARMMESATSFDRRYDMVIVQSLSRFTRDPAFQAASYVRLRAADVAPVSVYEQ